PPHPGYSLEWLDAVACQRVDDDDIDPNHGQRPEGRGIDEEQLSQHTQDRAANTEPAPPRMRRVDSEPCGELAEADEQLNPPPGAHVGEEECRVRYIEGRAENGHDPFDDVDDAGEREHGDREEDDARAVTSWSHCHRMLLSFARCTGVRCRSEALYQTDT